MPRNSLQEENGKKSYVIIRPYYWVTGDDELNRAKAVGMFVLMLLSGFGMLVQPAGISHDLLREGRTVTVDRPVPEQAAPPANTGRSAIESEDSGGSWFDDLHDDSGLEWKDNVSIREGSARLTSGRYRRSITIVNDAEALQDYPVSISFNNTTFDYSRANTNGEDIRFFHRNGTELYHWIENWKVDNETRIWVNIPEIPNGISSIRMQYGDPDAESTGNGENVFDFFDGFSRFNATTWHSTGTASVGSGKLTVTTGTVYSNITLASQPGMICEAKVKWNNFVHWSGMCISDDKATQGSNAGSDSLVYLMTSSGGGNAVSAWAATGETASYDIVSGRSQFQAVQGEEYILGYAMNETNLTYMKNRLITNTYTGNWSAPFHLWFGYYPGSNGGTSDISDIVVDWLVVRKYTPKEPTTSLGSEELNPPACAISVPINLPEGTNWDMLSLVKTEGDNTTLRVSVLNASTNATLQGFENRSEENLDISNITGNSIRLNAWFQGDGRANPALEAWGVEWVVPNTWRDSFISDEKLENHSFVDVGAGSVKMDYWRYKKPINISHYGDELSDFQVLILLDHLNFDHSKASLNGEDMKFLDEEGLELNFWIEEWNQHGSSKIWVKIPRIRNGTTKIWMHYGNPDAEVGSDGDAVFDFIDDFQGDSVNTSKWTIADSSGWSVNSGQLRGANNNGRLLSKTSFRYPTVQEARIKVSQRAPNGFQVAGYYASSANCIGYLCHPQTDWLRNNAAWTPLGGEHIDLHVWYQVRLSVKSATTVNINIMNSVTGESVYKQDFTNAVWNEKIAIGKRSDNYAPGQSYLANWDYVRARKYIEEEPAIVIGDEYEKSIPRMVSVPILQPDNLLWSTLTVNKSEPGDVTVNVSVIDNDTNNIIPGFDNRSESNIDLDALNDMNVSNIRLIANFKGIGDNLPVIFSWSVNWSSIEAPELVRNIDDIEIFEDDPATNILNISRYFNDIYQHRKEPLYSLKNVSDTNNITIDINGSGLDVTFLMENWTGQTSVIMNCTNVYDRSTSSNRFNITVKNVNDPPEVELVFPLDRSILTEIDVILSWNASDIDNDLTDLTYDLYFSDSPTAPLYKSGITGTNYTLESLEDSTRYYWHVIPHDGENYGSCRDPVRSFTMNIARVALLSPADGAVINRTEIDLQWEVLNTKDDWLKFHVYLGTNPNNLSEINETRETSFKLDLPPANETYYWKIMVEFLATHRLIESEVRSFATWIEFEPLPEVHDIGLSLDRDRVEVAIGEVATVKLNISNRGTVRKNITLETQGGLEGYLKYAPQVVLDKGEQKFIDMVLSPGETLLAGNYTLIVKAKFEGGERETRLEVIILEKGADDNKEAGSNNAVWIAVGIFVLLLVIALLVLLIKRSKKKEETVEDNEVIEPEIVATGQTGDFLNYPSTSGGADGSIDTRSPGSPAVVSANMENHFTYNEYRYEPQTPEEPFPKLDVPMELKYKHKALPESRGGHPQNTDSEKKDIPGPEIEILPPEPSIPVLKDATVNLADSLPPYSPPVTETVEEPEKADETETGTSPEQEIVIEHVEETPAPGIAVEEPLGSGDYADVSLKEVTLEETPAPSPAVEEPPGLDDFTDVSSEEDTLEEAPSPIAPGENVLDAFSRFLDKMPSSLSPSEKEK